MALFIRRVETVVSLQQLEAASAATAAGSAGASAASLPCGAPAALESVSLEPDAPVSRIAWARLPKYSFAGDAAPKMSRLNSATDLARVPDMMALDDTSEACSSGTSGGSGGASCSAAAMMACTTSAPPSAAAAAAAAAAFGGGVTAAKAAALAASAPNNGSLALMCRGSSGDLASGLCEVDEEEGGEVDGSSSCAGSVLELGSAPMKSLLDSVLLAMWEECAEQGLFRYDVTACPTKVVPGQFGFVAQLNEGRYSKKRPTEFRIDQVVQPFDATKFNFTKAFRREVLFAFEPAGRGSAPGFEESGRAGPSPSVVLINVSPIDYGHVLLCPRVLDCLPQNLCPATARLALHFALEVDNPYLRVGFNSLGAFATINHLHFQAYYLAAPLPCERAPTRPLRLGAGGAAGAAAGAPQPPPSSTAATAAAGGGVGGERGAGGGAGGGDSDAYHPVVISLLADYPVRGWVVEGPSLAGMAQVVGEASLAMQAANIPHNVLIADCGSRVFIWPQGYAERQARGQVPDHLLDIGVNPAVWEISGHMVLKRAQDYAAFTEEAAWELLAAVSLTEDDMQRLSEQLWGDRGAAEPVGTGLSVGGLAQAAAARAAAAGGAAGDQAMAGVEAAAGPAAPGAGAGAGAGAHQQAQVAVACRN